MPAKRAFVMSQSSPILNVRVAFSFFVGVSNSEAVAILII